VWRELRKDCELDGWYYLGYTTNMKTAVSIPDPLFREAERLTKRLRIPRSQLYAKALEEYVQRQRSKGIKEALDEVYRTESSELDPVLANLQSEVLGRKEW
jgi:metal-responsive CopG/Arc/MetJ family transcriptional regulator